MKRYRFAIYALGLLAVVGLARCGGKSAREQAITMKGSDTMVILGQRWAEQYMAAHPGSVIQVTGGGSGTGIAALINGTTDICQSSRPMKDEEKTQLQSKFGTPPTEIEVARDGLSIYVHESNAVKELTLEQLKDVYTGKTTNWKALGGADAAITVYGRENNSGTYAYFKEHVLANADFAAAVQTLPGTAAVVNAVSKDANGIGYGGAAYAQGVRDLGIQPAAGAPGVMPTAENVKSGAYPISRALYFYLRKPPAGAIDAFVQYCLSDSGQKLAEEVGYFSVH